MAMSTAMKACAFLGLWTSVVFLSVYNLNGEVQNPFATLSSDDSSSASQQHTEYGINSEKKIINLYNLEYGFYDKTCPRAEKIVRSAMIQIFNDDKNVSASLLRMLFHDCFIQGCDASVLLDDHNGGTRKTEKQAVPNKSLKGFDKIDMIKAELERACPGVVSCADVLALATRDGILLAGGPFYPVFTGRRDSTQSYFQLATAEIPAPDGNISETLFLFSQRGFDERETVSLLGGHNIGKIGCDFIETRLNNFKGTGKPDPTITPEFIQEIMQNCNLSNNNNIGSPSSSTRPRQLVESTLGITYYQGLSVSVSSGSGFDTHYYQSLLQGRGLLFADQQLMADERTADLVSAYASDDGSAFRTDFSRVMVKLSNLNVLTGSQGRVRIRCSASV